AAVARKALAYWPAERAAFRAGLEDVVRLFEEISGLRRPHETFPLRGPLAMTADAFLALKYGVGPDRRAVLVIDAIRAGARAFHSLPGGPRLSVQDPTADELKDRSAVQVHEASRLLDHIEAAFEADSALGR